MSNLIIATSSGLLAIVGGLIVYIFNNLSRKIESHDRSIEERGQLSQTRDRGLQKELDQIQERCKEYAAKSEIVDIKDRLKRYLEHSEKIDGDLQRIKIQNVEFIVLKKEVEKIRSELESHAAETRKTREKDKEEIRLDIKDLVEELREIGNYHKGARLETHKDVVGIKSSIESIRTAESKIIELLSHLNKK